MIVIFYIVFSFTICLLILMQYIKWIKFTQFQCHCPLHHPSSKDVTLGMLPRNQNWYIQKGPLRISNYNRSIDRLLLQGCSSLRSVSRIAFLTLPKLGVAFKFPATVSLWIPTVLSHSSDFSVQAALNSLFQQTSGAWIYLDMLSSM